MTPNRQALQREREIIRSLSRPHVGPVGHAQLDTIIERALFDSASPGRRRSMTTVEWDIAGNGKLRCQSPRFRAMKGVEDRFSARRGLCESRPPQWMELTMPCRKCENCLTLRAIRWRERAKREIEAAERTWFGTLTLRPEEHFKVEMMARKRAAQAWEDFDYMTEQERLAARHREVNRFITLYVKRLRKAAERREGAEALRVMIVMEVHLSGGAAHGLPHYHALVHERVAGAMTKAELEGQWIHGFTKWRVVNEGYSARAAHYVAKYLAKSSLARVRASLNYGDTRPSGDVSEGTGSLTTGGQSEPQAKRETTTPTLPSSSDAVRLAKEGCD